MIIKRLKVAAHVISIVRCFVFKNTKHGLFENQEDTLRVSSKVRAVKRRGEIEDASNKSLDVSGKQRRCFLCQLACVCRHVSSIVRCLFTE